MELHKQTSCCAILGLQLFTCLLLDGGEIETRKKPWYVLYNIIDQKFTQTSRLRLLGKGGWKGGSNRISQNPGIGILHVLHVLAPKNDFGMPKLNW